MLWKILFLETDLLVRMAPYINTLWQLCMLYNIAHFTLHNSAVLFPGYRGPGVPYAAPQEASRDRYNSDLDPGCNALACPRIPWWQRERTTTPSILEDLEDQMIMTTEDPTSVLDVLDLGTTTTPSEQSWFEELTTPGSTTEETTTENVLYTTTWRMTTVTTTTERPYVEVPRRSPKTSPGSPPTPPPGFPTEVSLAKVAGTWDSLIICLTVVAVFVGFVILFFVSGTGGAIHFLNVAANCFHGFMPWTSLVSTFLALIPGWRPVRGQTQEVEAPTTCRDINIQTSHQEIHHNHSRNWVEESIEMQIWTDPTIPITPSNVFERKKKTIPVARIIPVQREVLLGTGGTGETGETGEDKKLDQEVEEAMADMETVVSEERPSTSSPLPCRGCTDREPSRKRKLCAPPVEARVARRLFPDVRLLEREPAKDRILDDLSRKRGRNSGEDSEAITSNKRECGEPMETETEEATTAASAPMESDESIIDELVHALVEEVAPAKIEDESDAELDFDDSWSMQGMWSSRSDVYSPAHDADDERSREENLAALEKSTKQVLDEVCDKLHSWRPYNSSTDTSPRSTPRDVASRASEREPLIIEEDELLPDLNLVWAPSSDSASPNSGTLSKRC